MKTKTKLIAFALLLIGSVVFTFCKKEDKVTPLTGGTPVTGNAFIDTSWTFEKAHSNVNWETRYADYSNTMLTGKFNDFQFKSYGLRPDGKTLKQSWFFDQTNMSKCYMKAWVRVSTYNTGEIGRDGYTGCGQNYVGSVFTDSNKTTPDPKFDTAWFESTSFTQVGTIPAAGYPANYIVKGNLMFNHYLNTPGETKGAIISKPVTMYLTYNGTTDLDANKDGTPDKLYRGFTGKFSFKRSDYTDKAATVAYNPFPKKSQEAANVAAANNKTFGVWSTSVADEIKVTINVEMYKKH